VEKEHEREVGGGGVVLVRQEKMGNELTLGRFVVDVGVGVLEEFALAGFPEAGSGGRWLKVRQ
jgi:hypothetical protein